MLSHCGKKDKKRENEFASVLPFCVDVKWQLLQLQVIFLDPAQLALDLAENDAQNSRQDKANQDHAQPVHAGD